MIKKQCKCGCRKTVNNDKNFVRGHNRKINIDANLVKRLYLKDELSINEISRKLNVGATTIRRTLVRFDVTRRSLREASFLAAIRGKYYMQSENAKKEHSRLMKGHQLNLIYKYNRDYFKKFSRNMAYTVGYIAADGCVTGKSLLLASKDKELLEDINRSLDSEMIVRKKGKYYNLSFSSIKILDDLKRVGITPRKTFTLMPPYIPKKLIPDFIRGFFDGDGCFAYHRTLDTYKSMITNASEIMLEWIHKNSPTKKGTVYKRKGTNCYELRYGLEDTIIFGKFIYKNLNRNSIFLKRKFDIFNKIINHQNNFEIMKK